MLYVSNMQIFSICSKTQTVYFYRISFRLCRSAVSGLLNLTVFPAKVF